MILENKPLSIKIKGSNNLYLSVTLTDILKCIENGITMKWSILYLYATGYLDNNQTMVSFEKNINEAISITKYSWEEINILSLKFEQLYGITLIGAQKEKDMRRYSKDDDMFKYCDYSIMLIDSSYWIIDTFDSRNLRNIIEILPGVELLYPDPTG